MRYQGRPNVLLLGDRTGAVFSGSTLIFETFEFPAVVLPDKDHTFQTSARFQAQTCVPITVNFNGAIIIVARVPTANTSKPQIEIFADRLVLKTGGSIFVRPVQIAPICVREKAQHHDSRHSNWDKNNAEYRDQNDEPPE